jgi:ferredoxin
MSAKYSDLSGYFQHKGRQFAEKCTNCGLCLEACPVFPLTRAAGVGAKVAITKVTDLLKGGAPSDEAYEVVFSCNRGCGLCAKACPEGLMPYYLGFIPAAARLIEEGMPLPALTYQHLPGHRYSAGNLLSALKMEPSGTRWMKRPPPCGVTSKPLSILDRSESMRRAPMNEAEAAGADVLATVCAGCHESFAPLEAGYPFQVRSFISLMAESVGVQREDKFKRYMRLASVPRIIGEARDCLDDGDYTVDEVKRVLPDYLKRFCPGHGLVR